MKSLSNLGKLEWLATLDKPGTSGNETGLNVGNLLKGTVLGASNSLGEVLLGDVALRDGLDDLDGLSGGRADGLSWAREVDGEETSVGVCGVDGRDVGAWCGSGGLGEKGETWGPLDGGLSAQKSSKDSDLWLVAGSSSERAGAWERNNVGVVGAGVSNTLLSSEVLGGWAGELAAGPDIAEELTHPFGDLSLASTVGDNGDVGLGVGRLGELSDAVLVKILGQWSLGGWVQWCAEAGVKCNTVNGIASDLGGVVVGAVLLDVDG